MNDAICRLVSDPLRNSPSVPPFLPEMTVYVLLISLKGLFGGIFSPLPDSSVGDGSRSLVFCCIWGDHTTDLYMYNIYICFYDIHIYIYTCICMDHTYDKPFQESPSVFPLFFMSSVACAVAVASHQVTFVAPETTPRVKFACLTEGRCTKSL